MYIYGKENIKHESEKLVAEWLESYNQENAKYKFDFAIASKELVIESDEDIEIDFVLAGQAGIFVIEVKGGNVSIEDGVWKSNGYDLKENPFKQAKHHFYGLWRFINSDTSLKNIIGYYAVVFPGIHLSKPLDASYPMAMYFDSRFGQAPEGFLDGAIELSHLKHGVKKLNKAQLQEIKELLVPNYDDYIIDLTASDDDKILKLSDEQIVALEALEDNKRIMIKGPPGSGKTIIALEQALINENKEIKTLFICHNRALANKLSILLRKRIGHEPKHILLETIEFLKSNVINGDYEYLIADEAQDYLSDDNFSYLDKLMAGGMYECKFRIFYDENQDLFCSTDMTFLNEILSRDDVIRYELKYNYRNTQMIWALAYITSRSMPGEMKNNPKGEKLENINIPTLVDSDSYDWSEYYSILSKTINNLLDAGYKSNEIIIVSAQSKHKGILKDIDNIKVKNGVQLTACREVDWENNNSIVYGSVFEMKGLDSKVAIVTDLFKPSETTRSLVSITRARSKAILFVGKHFYPHLFEK
jgi:hypothetical protein